jgi:hypothetical protein
LLRFKIRFFDILPKKLFSAYATHATSTAGKAYVCVHMCTAADAMLR